MQVLCIVWLQAISDTYLNAENRPPIILVSKTSCRQV